MDIDEFTRKMKVHDMWVKEHGGKELDDLLITLVKFNIITSEISYEIYEGFFERAYYHWKVWST